MRVGTYRSTPLVILWYISALAFFVGLGFIDIVTPASQALLGTEMRELLPLVPVGWGILGVLSVAAEMLGVAIDSRYLTRAATIAYVVLWAFAGGIYLTGGYLVLFFAVSLPHFLFWAWNLVVRYDHARIVREVRSLLHFLAFR